MAETRATCPYCGVGCGVIIEHDAQRISGVRGDPLHPANHGRLCTKGATLHLSARPESRALYPALREGKDAVRQRVSWAHALGAAAERFARVIAEHGPDAVGFYVSGQLLTEDYYVFNKLAKGLIGTNNIDTNSRLCMSSAVAAYKRTLGADAPPCSYDDFDHADCILIAGANPAYAHPVAYRRIEAARAAQPGKKLIVIDPRRTDTAEAADLHLALLPGTDVWLLNALLNVLIFDGYVDHAFVREHTTGFAALREHVRDVTPAVAARRCGVAAEDIVQAARWWGEAQAPLSLWCQGLNQSHHGTDNGTALIALSLAVGKIGQPGCGPFSLTGQPNAMGGREVGGMANLASAHRDLANPEHRAEVAALWGVDSVPAAPGLTAVQMFEAARSGKLKALWIACTNPAHSMPHQALVREALSRCEFVVVQEAYADTETARYADLLLPARTWGEREGTVTNSERRITHVNAALSGPGEARADWRIVCDFALALGRQPGFGQAANLFAYERVESIFQEHVLSTAGRDLDITGLSYALLDAQGPQQWPYPAGQAQGLPRLYASARFAHDDGKAKFVLPGAELTAEAVDARYPLHLTTGRLRDHWHCMARTGKVAQLYGHVAEPRIELAAQDMQARGIAAGELLRVSSRRGQVVLPAQPSESVRPGQAFIAMHWGRNVLASSGANELTLNATDPYAHQPALKHAAIRLDKANLTHHALCMVTAAQAEAATHLCLTTMAAVAPLLAQFAYASVHLAGREHPVVVLRIAHDAPLSPEVIARLDGLFGLGAPSCVAYQDVRRGISKRAHIEADRLLALRLCGELAAAAWLQEALVSGRSTAQVRRWLLAPVAQAPLGQTVTRGRVVCNCANVSEAEIREAAVAGLDLEQIQAQLKCGSGCGACMPEVRRLVVRHGQRTATAVAGSVPGS